MDLNQRVALLRKEMRGNNIDMCMITTEDAYIPVSGSACDYWRSLRWLTGFTGSLAYAIVTQDSVQLWTDSRYHLQAAEEVHIDDVSIHNVSEVSASHFLEWMQEYFSSRPGSAFTFGVDGRTISAERGQQILSALDRIRGKSIRMEAGVDLINRIWENRPAEPFCPIYEMELKYAGKSRQEKSADVRAEMTLRNADYYIAAGAEGVPWVTNMRGHDSPFAPTFPAHMLFSRDRQLLFCKREALPSQLEEKLQDEGYELYDISVLAAELGKIPHDASVYMDEHRTNYLIPFSIPKQCRIITGYDIINNLKAVKNSTEIANMRRVELMESVALFRMFRDVKQGIKTRPLTEYDPYLIVEEYRKLYPEYISMGPKGINNSGYNAHSAWPHYAPTAESHWVMESSGLMVLDICSQWLGGSTDTCRTIYLGPCQYDREMKQDYTLVLKALITAYRQIIHKDMAGSFLDSVVRAQLWNNYCQFGHGAGHGIGYANSVLEGPQFVAQPSYKKSWGFSELPIKVGNILALEPGVYREGKYGVRLENNFLVVEDHVNEFGQWYRLENLFWQPFESDLIDPDMLYDDELEWVNAYHQKTYEMLAPMLEESELDFLKKLTAPLYKSPA